MRCLVLVVATLLTLSSPTQAFEANFLMASTADLGNPHGVKLSTDGRWLFVSDVDNDRVAILDAESLDLLGHFGVDHQKSTHDLDIGEDGRLYVADTNNHRIGIYELIGTEAELVGEVSARIRKPEGVLAGPDGRIYATGAGSHNLVVYENGKVTKEVGGFSAPHDIEFAPNGDLWVADAANDRLVRLTPELEIQEILQGAPYNFSGPRYLDVAPDGTLVVADKYTHTIKIIAPAGKFLGTIGDRSSGKGPNKFRTPEGVELRGDIAWISDSGNNRIVKYRLSFD